MKPTKLFLLTGLICAALFAGSLANQAKDNKAEVALQAAIKTETVDGNLKGAIEQYQKIAAQPGAGRATVATALLRMGQCYEKLGDAQAKEARAAYERVVREFGDQAGIVAQARTRLAALAGAGGAGGLVMRRILADASGIHGVLTADGKYIRDIDWYKTGDGLQFDLAGGQTSRIPNKGGPEAIEGPYDYEAFSRDCTRVAYDFYTKDEVPQLRVRNLDGSGIRTLYSDSEKKYEVHPFDWTPDGKSILALRDLNNETEVVLISASDGALRVLRKSSSHLKNAEFSPDGRYIALSFVGENNQSQGDIFMIAADGRDEVVIAGHPAEDQLLAWTPDGKGLVFLSNRSGTWDIWTVAIAGGKQQGEPALLKKDFGNESDVLGFAPEGSLYYKSSHVIGGLYMGEIDLETGKVLAPPAPQITRYAGPINFMSWSPDGRSLLYLSHPGTIGPGNNLLTIRSTATGEERFLSPRLYGVNQITWAPDGRSIIALGFGYKNADSGAYRIDAETGGITKLGDGGVFARLCPDGKTLLQYTDEGIVKRNLDTGKESVVAKKGAPHYALSPDGRNVAYQIDGVVKIVSLDGGEPQELFRGLAPYYMLGWTRDGRYIIACVYGSESPKIWRVPAEGGTPLKLDLSVPKMYNFAPHPDNRRFSCSISEKSKSELWVMENFLPPLKVAK